MDRSQGGLGLGLALVKGLVGLHGGSVTAASPGPGRGPSSSSRMPRASEPAAVTEVPEANSGVPRRLRVLVVEDQADAADSLRLLLEAAGHEVAVARSGQAGWTPPAGGRRTWYFATSACRAV